MATTTAMASCREAAASFPFDTASRDAKRYCGMAAGLHGLLQARADSTTDLSPAAPETGRHEAAVERPR